MVCHDLRYRWQTELCFAFDTLSFYVPQAALDELTDELLLPRISALTCGAASSETDPVAYHLACALVSIVSSKTRVPSLLADQILHAFRFHLVSRYGGLDFIERPPEALSALQLQRIRALLLDELWRDVRIADLAGAVEMPVRTFERAFRRHFGKAPHQWRLEARVEQARGLLEHSAMSIAEIAYRCGFSDQSHLTRVFGRLVGTTPAAYRRSTRH